MKLNAESESLLSEPGGTLPGEKIDRQSNSSSIKIDEKLDARKIPRQFSRQYCHSYSVRLWSVRPKLEETLKSEWPGVEVKKVAELCEFSQAKTSSHQGNNGTVNGGEKGRNSEDHGQHISYRQGVTVAIIGTVFKYQPEKPSILQELSEDNPMVPTVPRTKYTSDKDTIQLEDETTRVQLIPTPDSGMTIGSLVNGIICAVKGRPNINGKFEVTDVIFPTPVPRPILDCKMDIEMVFVSGMDLANGKNVLQAGLFFDYLEGLSGCPSEAENNLKKKTKVFFVGDTFGSKLGDKDQASFASLAMNIDEKLDQISQTMDVLILPSENDPSKPMLPQAPIHHCILPRASRRPTFKALSNPARLEIPMSNEKESQSLDIILSSGLNVKDAIRNSEISNPLEMEQSLLRWGHLCPTAPDTLPLHPGADEDLFVVNTMPHIFVVGNQESFDAMEWMNTKIFTLPKFSETGTAVLLTSDLDLVELNFKLS